MNIREIGAYRYAIVDAVKVLSDISRKQKPLPRVEALDIIAERLKRLDCYEVIASIYEDNEFIEHKEFYINAFGNVLQYEIGVGVVKDGEEIFDYWETMGEKLEEEQDIDAEAYIEKVEDIRGILSTLIESMKRDLVFAFKDEQLFTFKDGETPKRERTQGRKKGKPLKRLPDREVKDSDFQDEDFEGVNRDFKLNDVIYNAIKKCLYKNVSKKLVRTALIKCRPDLIANGNRLDIIGWMFKKFAGGYIYDSERRKEYINICDKLFRNINDGFNIKTTSPHKHEQEKIWDENTNKFKTIR